MNYYATSGLFDDLCAFKNILTILNDYDMKDREYKDEIENLKIRIIELEERPCATRSKVSRTAISINTECKIKMEYILYIQRYGLPEDGIFLPSLLEELANECGCDCPDDDTQDIPKKKQLLLPDTDVYGNGFITDYNQSLNFSNITEITEIN
jgi:translation initiation factor 1 (eIF-1/SUI1)